MPDQVNAGRVGDLISISPSSPVVSLTDLERLGEEIARGADVSDDLAALLTHYCLDDPDTRAAFDAMLSGLARREAGGDAFQLQGVYGSGKSHLLAVIALLCEHPGAAWPAFVTTHPQYEAVAERFARKRLVAAIALDEYPVRTHPLEHIVLSRLEAELARCGVRAALTEQSHLLDLVERYVVPQAEPGLDCATRRSAEATGQETKLLPHGWAGLRERDPERAAEVALEFIESSQFPLDWRRSRGDAWTELQRALAAAECDGVVVALDELGLFLAGKDRRGLNADASFLQWLAQRTATARCWLICATQRGFEDVGDIDRRTLRQLRDRFRAGFTLDLSSIEWVVQHKVAPRKDGDAFGQAMARLCARYTERAGEELIAPAELAASYPLNPLCLKALRRAAETCLSRTRSIAKLIQEAGRGRRWMELPSDRLITPEVVFDLFRDELAMSAAGRKHLDAYEAVMANAARIARGEECELTAVMKVLCLLGVGELRWTDQMVRASLVGGEHASLWPDPDRLRSLLNVLYLRTGYIERVRGEDGDEYFVDVSSSAAEQIRRRLGELTAELEVSDSRVLRAALAACREPGFPIASLAEPASIGVKWLNIRRIVHAAVTDLREPSPSELEERIASLASPLSREDGCLLIASPLADPVEQESAWRAACEALAGRFAAAVAAWIPAALSEAAREHLIEHAALSMMVADRTLFRRAGDEARQKVRERWAASEAEARAVLQRAYYEGRVLGADGHELVVQQRLWALFGQWEETLSELFSGPFAQLFPRFAGIAPHQPLVGRLHTNQIIGQFIRPREVMLPPASTLEAHLAAFAAPLGLVEMEGRRARPTLQNAELVQAALAGTPERTRGEVAPEDTISVADLMGRLAKSEWGLTREQSELLIAALMRTGHLVGLDAFLQPVRLDQIAAPLGDNLPYVMRGAPLTGGVVEEIKALWQAASGRPAEEWSLPAQEEAWSFFVGWSSALRERSQQNAEAIMGAAAELGRAAEEWDWAREAMARAEALALSVDGSLASREGLTKLAAAAERLPGGVQQTCSLVADWRRCERSLARDLAPIAELHSLIASVHLTSEHGLLERQQRAVLAGLGRSERVVRETEEVTAAAHKWLESYRRHYLAWHARVHGAARFEPLSRLRASAEVEAVRRLGQAGLRGQEAAGIEATIVAALGKRCLAGDPLPEGRVTCAICGIGFRQELELPDAGELEARAAGLLREQLAQLASSADLLRRRMAGIRDTALSGAVGELIGQETRSCPTELCAHLSDGVIGWLRQQLGQPKAQRREISALVERLRGRELTKAEVVRIVEEWLGEGEGYVEVE
ncbi:MAG: DUF6079 family protein [Armatimonadota bacterium]